MEALQALATQVPTDATLAVLPEGAMLNYLARRRSSIPFANFMLPEVRHFGEASMLAALRAVPPDFLLLVHKDTREFGPRFFGADPSFGQEILGWVREDYRAVHRIRAEPLRRDEFGIQLMQHAPVRAPGGEPRR